MTTINTSTRSVGTASELVCTQHLGWSQTWTQRHTPATSTNTAGDGLLSNLPFCSTWLVLICNWGTQDSPIAQLFAFLVIVHFTSMNTIPSFLRTCFLIWRMGFVNHALWMEQKRSEITGNSPSSLPPSFALLLGWSFCLFPASPPPPRVALGDSSHLSSALSTTHCNYGKKQVTGMGAGQHWALSLQLWGAWGHGQGALVGTPSGPWHEDRGQEVRSEGVKQWDPGYLGGGELPTPWKHKGCDGLQAWIPMHQNSTALLLGAQGE
jgi:hypothetical protein